MMKFEEIQGKLKNYCIGIAGAGGLGSNCAVALARSGIGKVVVADFDVVDKSNLNRQYYFVEQIGQAKVEALKENIARINTETEVLVHNLKIEKANVVEIFAHCDIIVEAFDLAEMKQMLIETVLDKLPKTPIVSGLGMAGWGNNNTIKSRNIDNLHLCGDETSEVSEINPPLAPRVGIVANMQANTVLEIILGK
jgi:sulfur carrier protein ThiS adenylyltransferase